MERKPAPTLPQPCGCLSLDCHKGKNPRGLGGAANSADLSSVLTSAFWDGTSVFFASSPRPSLTKARGTGQGQAVDQLLAQQTGQLDHERVRRPPEDAGDGQPTPSFLQHTRDVLNAHSSLSGQVHRSLPRHSGNLKRHMTPVTPTRSHMARSWPPCPLISTKKTHRKSPSSFSCCTSFVTMGPIKVLFTMVPRMKYPKMLTGPSQPVLKGRGEGRVREDVGCRICR